MSKTIILAILSALALTTITTNALQVDIVSQTRAVYLDLPLSTYVDVTNQFGHWSAEAISTGAESRQTSFLASPGNYNSYSIFGDLQSTLLNNHDGGDCCVGANSVFRFTFQIHEPVRYTISAEIESDVIENEYGYSSVFLREDDGDEEVVFSHISFDGALSIYEQGILSPGQYFFNSGPSGFFVFTEPSNAYFAGSTSFEFTLQPVPLPPAAVLLFGALGSLNMFRRRL